MALTPSSFVGAFSDVTKHRRSNPMRTVVPVNIGTVEERLAGRITRSTLALVLLGASETALFWHVLPSWQRTPALAVAFTCTAWLIKGEADHLPPVMFMFHLVRFLTTCHVWHSGPTRGNTR
jgi:hypothetical protein